MSDAKIIDGDDTAEFQLAAAQSELAALHGLCEDRFNELAALREELAKWQGIAGRRTAERTEFMNERDEYKQANANLIESCAEKFDLLTAAEQRNAVQRGLLHRALNVIRGMRYDELEAAIVEELNG